MPACPNAGCPTIIRRRAVAMRQPYKRVPNATFVFFGRSKRDGDGVFTAGARTAVSAQGCSPHR